MKPLNLNKQLKLLTNTLAAISEKTDEESKVNVILDALTNLGFSGNIRCRIAVLEENYTILAIKYARGDYGSINPHDIRYKIGESITGRAALRGENGDFKPKSIHINPNSESSHDRSLLSMPILNNGKLIGVLNLDSPETNGFTNDRIEMLRPYSYLLAGAIIPPVDKHEEDIISLLKRFKEKQVLVLGKDTGHELKYLNSVSDILKSFDYIPLLVKNHADLPELSNEEKVRVLADISRFVVLENTFPAGQIAECKICAINRIICASIRQSGKGSSYMVTDYFKDYDFMEEFEYKNNQKSMKETLRQAIEWAEQKIKERVDYYNKVYPWRK